MQNSDAARAPEGMSAERPDAALDSLRALWLLTYELSWSPDFKAEIEAAFVTLVAALATPSVAPPQTDPIADAWERHEAGECGGCDFCGPTAAQARWADAAYEVAVKRQTLDELADDVVRRVNEDCRRPINERGSADSIIRHWVRRALSQVAAAPLQEPAAPPEIGHASFEVREDEETGRRFWYGGEEGWKGGTEVGRDEDGALVMLPEHFAVGTRITMEEPINADE